MAITRLAKPKAFSQSARDFIDKIGVTVEDVYEALANGERTNRGIKFNNMTVVLSNDVIDRVFVDSNQTSVKCEYCRDTKKQKVYNECDRCSGVGCRRCNKGFIPSYIPCQSCKGKPYASQHH